MRSAMKVRTWCCIVLCVLPGCAMFGARDEDALLSVPPMDRKVKIALVVDIEETSGAAPKDGDSKTESLRSQVIAREGQPVLAQRAPHFLVKVLPEKVTSGTARVQVFISKLDAGKETVIARPVLVARMNNEAEMDYEVRMETGENRRFRIALTPSLPDASPADAR